MADTPHDGSGTVVYFPTSAASNAYTVTNIVYNLNDVSANDTIDVSHLGLTTGAAVLSQSRPLTGSATDTGREVQIDVIGKNTVADASTGTLTITGGLTLSKGATVASSSVTLGVNDVIKGSITFKVAR